MPQYIYYNGAVWLHGYSNLFGTGYRLLTDSLRKHPKHKFIAGMQALKMLINDKCQVAINVAPKQQIIDTITYQEWKDKLIGIK